MLLQVTSIYWLLLLLQPLVALQVMPPLQPLLPLKLAASSSITFFFFDNSSIIFAASAFSRHWLG
jgi:hypothetical protein